MCKSQPLGAAEPIPAFAMPPAWPAMKVQDSVRKGVVFLGWKEGEKFSPKATGFIMTAREGDSNFSYIVTAEHCIGKLYEPDDTEKPRDVRISVNRLEGPPALIEANYKDWWHHPGPETADVAVIPVGLDERVHDFTWGGIEQFVVTDKLIVEKEIGVGDEVFIVGLFRNHTGRRRNIPIVRIGNIATMPEEPVWTRYGNIEAYLIEARSIGGLSGSPVFVGLGPWRVINNAYRFQSGMPFYLLGLMHGHFDVKDLNADVVQDAEEMTQTGIHSGIGVVIPASKIVETIMQKDLIELRKKAIKEHLEQSTVVPDFASESANAPSKSDENHDHRKDFESLLGAAAKRTDKG